MKVNIALFCLIGITVISCKEESNPINNTVSQWEDISAGLPGDAMARSFAVNDSFLFIGTTQYGIYRSSDNGLTWNQINSGLPNNMVIMSNSSLAADGEDLFLGTENRGLYHSTNNGLTWAVINNGIDSIGGPIYTPFCTVAKYNNIVLVGGIANTSTPTNYISTDNGNNWTPTSVTHSTYGFTMTSEGIYAATNMGVYRSDLLGNGWNNPAIGITSQATRTYYSITSLRDTLYASFEHLYRSTNYGQSWIKVYLNSGNSEPYIKNIHVFDGKLIVNSQSRIYFSDDNGRTFYSIFENIPINDYMIYDCIIEGNWIIVSTYNAGIWRHPFYH